MPERVIVEPKPLRKSVTAWLHAVVTAGGALLVIAPDLIAQILTILTSDETRSLLQFMPEKYRNVLDAVVRALGVLGMIIGAVTIWLRKFKTVGPISGATAESLPPSTQNQENQA